MNRPRWLYALLFAALLLPLIVQAQTPSHEPVPPDVTERHQPRPLTWRPCPENATIDCATLTLPVDYDKPNGDTFDMAVARSKASDPRKRIGVVFTNPGGPGISGVDFVMFVAPNVQFFAPYRERFDIISFDPRGVGRSRPLKCAPEPLALPDDRSAASLAAYFDGLGRRYAKACLQ